MLVTVGEDLKPLPVTVRVGNSVETVGLAGRPKTITGFQTHTTPVLLQIGERAELATDESDAPLRAVAPNFSRSDVQPNRSAGVGGGGGGWGGLSPTAPHHATSRRIHRHPSTPARPHPPAHTLRYLPLTSVLEGVVILKKNPNFEGVA